jgi:hypothetical protein
MGDRSIGEQDIDALLASSYQIERPFSLQPLDAAVPARAQHVSSVETSDREVRETALVLEQGA